MATNAHQDNSLELAVQAYLERPNDGNLEHVIERAERLVGYFVSKYAARGNYDDLMQAGYEGVLKALPKYDPDREVLFTTFASHYIKGEITQELKRKAAFEYGGKWMAKLQRDIQVARDRLRKELGEEPSLAAIARAVNVTEAGVQQAMMLGTVKMEDIDLSKIKSREYQSFQLPIEDKIVLEEALNKLSKVQRQVIDCLFYRDMTQETTGEFLGIHQRKVSRVKRKALSEITYLLG